MNGWPKLDFYFKEVTATLAWGGYFFVSSFLDMAEVNCYNTNIKRAPPMNG